MSVDTNPHDFEPDARKLDIPRCAHCEEIESHPRHKGGYAGKAIVKGHQGFGGWSFNVMGSEPHIRYLEIEREVPGSKISNSVFTHVEGTGRFVKSKFMVNSPGSGRTIDANAAGIKSAVRLVREREADELTATEAKIAAARQALADAQAERREVLKRAFTNGHVFTLTEAKAIADRNLEAYEARKAAKE